MPIRNSTMIDCDCRITPWVLAEDALDRLEAIIWQYEIPYVVQSTAGNNRSLWVPHVWRPYLPKAAKEEIARIVLEVKFGGVKPKEVTA